MQSEAVIAKGGNSRASASYEEAKGSINKSTGMGGH
jgi:hypothetical protein